MIAQIVLQLPEGSRELTVETFLKLPLDQRIQYILERRVCFYDDDHALIERDVALKELRTWKR